MNANRKTITTWEEPGYKMPQTSHGFHITYLQWCRAEADRITRDGTPCGIVWNKYNMCAVAEVEDEPH